MTTGQMIDLVLDEVFNLPSTSTDANYSAWRKRLANRLQTVVDEVWLWAPWDFKAVAVPQTVAVSSGVRVAQLPADFQDLGEFGGIWHTDQDEQLGRMEPSYLWPMWETNSGSDATGRPRNFAVITQSSSYRPNLAFDWTTDQAYTLRAYYDKIRPLILDAPRALTAASGSAGNLSGAYLYKVTFLGTDGTTESEAGVASTSVTVTSKQMSLTAIPTGTANVGSRKIYRTVGGGSTYKLVTTISDNTTTTYTDDVADGSLGATAPTTSSLQVIPQEYHYSVLFRGLLREAAKIQADLRSATEFEADFRRAMNEMKSKRAMRQSSPGRIGSDGLGLWGMH